MKCGVVLATRLRISCDLLGIVCYRVAMIEAAKIPSKGTGDEKP
jgi:hypothetical protein